MSLRPWIGEQVGLDFRMGQFQQACGPYNVAGLRSTAETLTCRQHRRREADLGRSCREALRQFSIIHGIRQTVVAGISQKSWPSFHHSVPQKSYRRYDTRYRHPAPHEAKGSREPQSHACQKLHSLTAVDLSGSFPFAWEDSALGSSPAVPARQRRGRSTSRSGLPNSIEPT
jgi:hypothetical protein